jgi:hypothetical protein
MSQAPLALERLPGSIEWSDSEILHKCLIALLVSYRSYAVEFMSFELISLLFFFLYSVHAVS